MSANAANPSSNYESSTHKKLNNEEALLAYCVKQGRRNDALSLSLGATAFKSVSLKSPETETGRKSMANYDWKYSNLMPSSQRKFVHDINPRNTQRKNLNWESR